MKIKTALAGSAMLALPLCLASTQALADTRGYLISWFSTATYNDYNANCPMDKNGGGLKLQQRNLMDIGYTEQEALDIINGVKARDPDITKRINTRAIVNGKPANVANYPEAVRDPNIETVSGKYAYGFDLGGKNTATKFQDADTGEKIDNQLWRAVGCTESYRATPPEQPYPEELSWNTMIDTAPGWAIHLTGEDLDQDGPVTVTLDRLLQHPERDAQGKVMAYMTYVIDPSPRSHNVFKGHIKDGILTIEPSSLFMQGQLPFYAEVALRNAHMRLRGETDGRLTGYWGGYLDWQRYAYMYTSRPANGADYVGLYHALKKMADANPDPKTGQNREISATFRMEAVPAYLADLNHNIVAPAHEIGGRPTDVAKAE